MKASLGKYFTDPISENKVGGAAQVVKHLTSKCETLSSNLNTIPPQKKMRGNQASVDLICLSPTKSHTGEEPFLNL
jgi:hypothetical protein